MRSPGSRHGVSRWALLAALLLCGCGSPGVETGSGPGDEAAPGGTGADPVAAEGAAGAIPTPSGAIDEAPSDEVEAEPSIDEPAELEPIERPDDVDWPPTIQLTEKGYVASLRAPDGRTWHISQDGRTW